MVLASLTKLNVAALAAKLKALRLARAHPAARAAVAAIPAAIIATSMFAAASSIAASEIGALNATVAAAVLTFVFSHTHICKLAGKPRARDSVPEDRESSSDASSGSGSEEELKSSDDDKPSFSSIDPSPNAANFAWSAPLALLRVDRLRFDAIDALDRRALDDSSFMRGQMQNTLQSETQAQ
eukprot:6197958-Pleurochrysis_carterae.AAC.1